MRWGLPRCTKALLATTAVLMLAVGCGDRFKPKTLGITGYNYTDRYIDSFEVDGQGGGNVFLSTATTGGGKTSCCIVFNPAVRLPVKMNVRWTFGYKRDTTGAVVVPDERHETTAVLEGPIPDEPRLLEVHFMPDRTVRLRITQDYSPPMLVIDRRKGEGSTP